MVVVIWLLDKITWIEIVLFIISCFPAQAQLFPRQAVPPIQVKLTNFNFM